MCRLGRLSRAYTMHASLFAIRSKPDNGCRWRPLMIPHFRESLHADPASNVPEETDEMVGEEDRNLDVLMKHAVRSTNWLEHDPKQVWQRLSERVRGPNGEVAVEQPANLGSSQMPYPEQYE